MTVTATINRTTQTFDTFDSYELVESFTLKAEPSDDPAVTAMKELLIKLAPECAWGSLLLDMSCLKAADRTNWQQPVAHLLPVLKRFGTDAQVEQALTEFAEENIPAFTTLKEFDWGRCGGLYWEPHYWWGYLKKFATPEIKEGFWDKMQEFWGGWDPCTPELEEDFAEKMPAIKAAAEELAKKQAADRAQVEAAAQRRAAEFAEAVEAEKVEKARKNSLSDAQRWDEAMEEGYTIDKCLSEADQYREFIERDIRKVKRLLDGGDPLVLIKPPAWLIDLLVENDIEFY